MALKIIYRTCEVVESMHGTGRPFGLRKAETIDACFASLVRSLHEYGGPAELIVVGDRLSEERLGFFRPHADRLVLGEFGNGGSIIKTFEVAETEGDADDVLFFCEDDYLFATHAVPALMDFFGRKATYLGPIAGSDLFLHPPDYPDRYTFPDRFTGEVLNFSLVFLTDYCHWRQVPSTTYTFLCSRATYDNHREALRRSAPTWDDRLLSREVYTKSLCLSPIPGLATHMHEHTMTPLVDWERYLPSRSASPSAPARSAP